MAWRVIRQGDRRWQVSIAAERRSNVAGWTLVFCFRSPGRRSVWVPAAVTSPSQAELYRQAERIGDDELLELLDRADAAPGESRA